MPDVTVALDDVQQRELEAAARAAGMTVAEFAAHAASRAVAARYLLPKTPGSVVALQSKKRD